MKNCFTNYKYARSFTIFLLIIRLIFCILRKISGRSYNFRCNVVCARQNLEALLVLNANGV